MQNGKVQRKRTKHGLVKSAWTSGSALVATIGQCGLAAGPDSGDTEASSKFGRNLEEICRNVPGMSCRQEDIHDAYLVLVGGASCRDRGPYCATGDRLMGWWSLKELPAELARSEGSFSNDLHPERSIFWNGFSASIIADTGGVDYCRYWRCRFSRCLRV